GRGDRARRAAGRARGAPADARGDLPGAHGMRLFLHELRAQQLLFWRNREAAFFTFFLPVIFFLIFGAVYGNDYIRKEHVKGSHFLEAGMIGYGVAATCFAGLAISMVVRREAGVLKRIRATPLPAATYILGVLGSTFVVFLIEAFLIIVIGRVLFSVPVPRAMLSLLFVHALGALAFAATGPAITGLVRSSEGSSAVINAVYLPAAIISGTFFTPESYPGFLKAIANVLPLTHYTALTRDVMLHNAHFWSDAGAIGVVLLWGAIGVVGAVRGFRWQPQGA